MNNAAYSSNAHNLESYILALMVLVASLGNGIFAGIVSIGLLCIVEYFKCYEVRPKRTRWQLGSQLDSKFTP